MKRRLDSEEADEEDILHRMTLDLRRRAMDLLARREHSRQELEDKISARVPELEDGLLDAVLDQLEADNLLSDHRFAESYVRMRRDKGYGPLYIQSRLQQCGVSRQILDAVLDGQSGDWFDAAESALQRKAGGGTVPVDEKYRARLLRFLASRGFTAEQSHKALRKLSTPAD